MLQLQEGVKKNVRQKQTSFTSTLSDFVKESRSRHTTYWHLKGSFGRREMSTIDTKDLQDFVDCMLFYEENSDGTRVELDMNQKEQVERTIEKLVAESRQFHDDGRIYIDVVWTYCYNQLTGETIYKPVFKIFKKKNEHDCVYIDVNLCSYSSWDEFCDFGLPPNLFVCAPRNGRYSVWNDRGELDLIIFKTSSSCLVPYCSSREVVSSSFFNRDKETHWDVKKSVSQRETSFTSGLRNFVKDGRARQTTYWNLEGSFERREMSTNDKKDLQDFVDCMLFYEENSDGTRVELDMNQKEQVENIVEKLVAESRQFHDDGLIYLDVVWTYCYNQLTGETIYKPVFKIFKKKNEHDCVYIDVNLCSYSSWDEFCDYGFPPNLFVCAPRNGRYSMGDDEGELDLIIFKTSAPPMLLCYINSKVVSSPFFVRSKVTHWLEIAKANFQELKVLPLLKMGGAAAAIVFFSIVPMKLKYWFDKCLKGLPSAIQIVRSHSLSFLNSVDWSKWAMVVLNVATQFSSMLDGQLVDEATVAWQKLKEAFRSRKGIWSAVFKIFSLVGPPILYVISACFPQEVMVSRVVYFLTSLLGGFKTLSEAPTSKYSIREVEPSLSKENFLKTLDSLDKPFDQIKKFCEENLKTSSVEKRLPASVLASDEPGSPERMYLFLFPSLPGLIEELKKLVGDDVQVKGPDAKSQYSISRVSGESLGWFTYDERKLAIVYVSRDAELESARQRNCEQEMEIFSNQLQELKSAGFQAD